VFEPSFIENTGMEDVTHKQIYDRLIEVEKKVDDIDRNTIKVVEAFDSVQGAFTVLGWIAAAAKPILWIVAGCTALYAVFENFVRK
jgi:hypothetical protein